MRLLAHDFEVYAVDLRGQGRSTRTPGRYTVDNMGNDLVRFISGRIGRPVIVVGNSSGGLRTHIRKLYMKFDAHRRAELVARARSLGLLAPPGASQE